MKPSSESGIIVAQEIRDLITENKAIKGPEVMTALRKKFPKLTFNDKSCQVSYANIRKSMGLSRTIKRKPEDSSGIRWMDTVHSESNPVAVDFNLLQAAKEFLKYCNGDVSIAMDALKQISKLQIT